MSVDKPVRPASEVAAEILIQITGGDFDAHKTTAIVEARDAEVRAAALERRSAELEAALRGIVGEFGRPDYPKHSGMSLVWLDKARAALAPPATQTPQAGALQRAIDQVPAFNTGPVVVDAAEVGATQPPPDPETP